MSYTRRYVHKCRCGCGHEFAHPFDTESPLCVEVVRDGWEDYTEKWRCVWRCPKGTENTFRITRGPTQCPCCDFDACDEESRPDNPHFVGATKPRFNMAASLEYGGSPQDWEETWRCPFGTEFSFSDANH